MSAGRVRRVRLEAGCAPTEHRLGAGLGAGLDAGLSTGLSAELRAEMSAAVATAAQPPM